jgi:fructosamine-3-kinase
LHSHTALRFGFPHDYYLGNTHHPHPWSGVGFNFFAEHRLIYQAELAGQRRYLSSKEVQMVENIAGRLRDWIPHQPASIIHGDLWSGNMISDEAGRPALIDPATYYGWAESDLAMMVLFGSPSGTFLHAYQEARPIPPGVESRFPIYNLYHLLNHLNIFGSGYYQQVMGIIRKFE